MLSMTFDFKGKGVVLEEQLLFHHFPSNEFMYATMLVGFFLNLNFQMILRFCNIHGAWRLFFLYLAFHGVTDRNIIYKRPCQVSFDCLLLKIIFIILPKLYDKLQH